MRNKALFLAILLSFNANAITEAEFQKCVQVKDVVLAVAEQADKGVTRAQIKAVGGAPSLYELIDWVYDFRGAFTIENYVTL